MKQLLMGLMLVITATAASAEWTIAGETRGGTDDYIQYVDRATIRRNGDLVKMWDLKDYKTVTKSRASGVYFLSDKSQSEYDCKEEKMRFLAYAYSDGKMGSGKVVYSNIDSSKWIPIAPESTSETLWKIACGK